MPPYLTDAIGIFSPCGTAVVWPFRFVVAGQETQGVQQGPQQQENSLPIPDQETQGVATFFITHSQKSWVILLINIRIPNKHMMTINFDTITNNYEVIYVIKTVMKYYLNKIASSKYGSTFIC
jgi:hypothetical protein